MPKRYEVHWRDNIGMWNRVGEFDTTTQAVEMAAAENRKWEGGKAEHRVWDTKHDKAIYRRGWLDGSPSIYKGGE